MKKILLLLVVLLTGVEAWATNYITDVMVIGGSKTEVNTLKSSLAAAGWTVIDKDLNAGCGSGSDYIYLLYKEASESTLSTFITDFVIVSTRDTAPDSITYQDCNYYLVDCDGGSDFKQSKGDLNCHAGGSYIHLYYTTNEFDSKCTAIKSITFNKTKDGAVVNKDTNEGYDLNSGAGGDYIYMHLNKAQGWLGLLSVDGSECYIYDFDGPKQSFTSVVVPTVLLHTTVLGFENFDFREFTNLETLSFHDNSAIELMPIMQNCAKFKHVNTIKDGEMNPDVTPPAMKRIPGHGFVGTAVEKITLDGVEQIGPSAFEGCTHLSEVKMNHTATIENLAFANIPQKCNITYAGPSSDWNPMMFKLSPKLAVYAETDTKYMGWCGATDDASHNALYWTMDKDKHLNIDSYALMWENYPSEQLITSQGWTIRESTTAVKDVKHLTLVHVDTIASLEFKDYQSMEIADIKSGTRIIGDLAFDGCNNLGKVYLPLSLTTIRRFSFKNCTKLADIYFDGSLQQWNEVNKVEYWDQDMPNGYKEHWRCTVYFNTNGLGLTPDPQTNLWSNESKVQKPNVQSVAQFVLAGWYKDAELNMPWDFNNDIVLGDMTLYAKWSEILNGDVNCDGMVDISDVNIIINIMLEKANVSDFPGNADLNGDDMIDIQDINHVINIMLKKI